VTQKPALPEDILIAARRRRLSVEETERLNELERDPAEAALTRAGRAFDAQDVESDGDAALALRMAEHALAAGVRAAPKLRDVTARSADLRAESRASGAHEWRSRSRGLLVATAVAVAAAAAAAAGGYVVVTRNAALNPTPTVAPTSAVRNAVGSPGGNAAARAAEPQQQSAATHVPPAEQLKVPAPSASARAVAEDTLSAELLFSRGNGDRRAGRMAEAASHYEQLLRGFPDSSEAQMARVSLGNLLLDQGRAARALALFDAHLARGSGLAEEALYGKARALRALGKLAQEREVWQTLAAKYPDSIFARSARERLEHGR